jgi:predicted nucleic acid-binding Zn ribbon protein
MGGLVPFYEYRRPDGTTIEVMQKMTDPPLTHDPETGVALERVFHPIAVHFKGKGFYNTDYGTKKRQREKAAESEAKKTSESSSGDAKSSDKADAKKTDAKPSESKAKDPGSSSASSSAGTKKD